MTSVPIVKLRSAPAAEDDSEFQADDFRLRRVELQSMTCTLGLDICDTGFGIALGHTHISNCY